MSTYFPVTIFFSSVFSSLSVSALLVADTKSFLQFPSDRFSQYVSESVLLSPLFSALNPFSLHHFNKLLV